MNSMDVIQMTSQNNCCPFMLFESGAVYADRESFKVNSAKTMRSEASTFIVPTLKQFVVFSISKVPEVERILAMLQERLLRVQIVVDAFDAQVRDKVYAKEESIIDEFGMFEFDFHIVSRRGRDISECPVDSSLELVFRR